MTRGKDGGHQPRAKEATAGRPIKVMLCDASAVVRRGLGQMLAGDDAIAVVAEAGSDEHVMALAHEASIHVAIGDPEHLGAEAITGLVALGVAVMLVSSQPEERVLMRALTWGCSGYLDQDEIRAGDLPRLVRLAAKGHCTLSERAVEILRRYLRQNAAVLNGHELDAPVGPTLSAREKQVLRHLARGRTNKAIAQLLNVSESTVKTHVLHIYDKLDVRTRLDLISLAIERGWVNGSSEEVAQL